MGTGALENGSAQGGIGPVVGDGDELHSRQFPSFIAGRRHVHAELMALGMDEDAFLARQLHFTYPFTYIGDEGSQMLDRHVFPAAEAAADEAVLDDDFFFRQAQHECRFPARIINALVRRINEDAVIKGHGDGTFRFQEGVFRPWRFKVVRHLILRGGNDGISVAADQVFMGQDVRTSRRVYQRRPFFQGVGCTGQGRQFFIFDIDELLSLFQDFRRFRSHQGDGVAQEVRRRADGDERIPIGLQMADFDGPGDIVCRQDADDTGQGLGLFRMDGLDDSPRISAADGTAVTHAGQVDGVQIICISADAQDFGLDVDALAGSADAAVAAADGKRLVRAQQICCHSDGVDDFLITRTTADIIADGRGDFQPRRRRVGVDEGLAAHDHAGDAEAALDGAGFAKGVDEDVFFPLGQPFDGQHVFTSHAADLLDTCLGRLAVDDDRTGSAGPFTAAILDGFQAQVIAQDVDELAFSIGFYFTAVYP